MVNMEPKHDQDETFDRWIRYLVASIVLCHKAANTNLKAIRRF